MPAYELDWSDFIIFWILPNWREAVSCWGKPRCVSGSKLLMRRSSAVFSVPTKRNFILTSASPLLWLYSKSVLQRDPSDQMGPQHSPSSFYALFFCIVLLSIWHTCFIHWLLSPKRMLISTKALVLSVLFNSYPQYPEHLKQKRYLVIIYWINESSEDWME